MTAALAQLSQVEGVIGYGLFDRRGVCINSNLEPPYEPVLLSETLRKLAALIDSLPATDLPSMPRHFVAECEEHCLVVRGMDQGNVVVMTTKTADMGMLNVALNVLRLELSQSEADQTGEEGDEPEPISVQVLEAADLERYALPQSPSDEGQARESPRPDGQPRRRIRKRSGGKRSGDSSPQATGVPSRRKRSRRQHHTPTGGFDAPVSPQSGETQNPHVTAPAAHRDRSGDDELPLKRVPRPPRRRSAPEPTRTKPGFLGSEGEPLALAQIDDGSTPGDDVLADQLATWVDEEPPSSRGVDLQQCLATVIERDDDQELDTAAAATPPLAPTDPSELAPSDEQAALADGESDDDQSSDAKPNEALAEEAPAPGDSDDDAETGDPAPSAAESKEPLGPVDEPVADAPASDENDRAARAEAENDAAPVHDKKDRKKGGKKDRKKSGKKDRKKGDELDRKRDRKAELKPVARAPVRGRDSIPASEPPEPSYGWLVAVVFGLAMSGVVWLVWPHSAEEPSPPVPGPTAEPNTPNADHQLTPPPLAPADEQPVSSVEEQSAATEAEPVGESEPLSEFEDEATHIDDEPPFEPDEPTKTVPPPVPRKPQTGTPKATAKQPPPAAPPTAPPPTAPPPPSPPTGEFDPDGI